VLASAFGEPLAEDRDGLAGQGCRALLPSFARDLDVGAGAEVDVADADADEL
jgi:hypothetical protein